MLITFVFLILSAFASCTYAETRYYPPFWEDCFTFGVGKLYLGSCSTVGDNCTRDAADEFCKDRFNDDGAWAKSFAVTKVTSADYTRSMFDNSVGCLGTRCTAFSSVVCAAGRGGSLWVYPFYTFTGDVAIRYPKGKAYLDVCQQGAFLCGKPTADWFCQQKGYNGSVNHLTRSAGRNDITIPYARPSDMCEGLGCTCYTRIDCN